MWKSRYKSIYKTSDPRLVITAVQSFPNIYDTLEKNIGYYNIKKLQNDPKLLEIVSLTNLLNVYGSTTDLTPLYFADTHPKLAKLKNLGKGWHWCICYTSPYHHVNPGTNRCSSRIDLPSHAKWCELLEYSINNLDGYRCQTLFNWCVIKYISEQTRHFTDEDNHIKYRLGSKVSYDWDDEKIRKEGLQFIDNMYFRNIYELMFNTLTK